MLDFTKLLSVRLVAGASLAATGVVALSIYNAPVTQAKAPAPVCVETETSDTVIETAVWGLYRVVDKKLVPVQNASLGDIADIEQLVDLDGDGELEVIGTPFIGGRIVNDVHGTTLQKLDEQFYGCPC